MSKRGSIEIWITLLSISLLLFLPITEVKAEVRNLSEDPEKSEEQEDEVPSESEGLEDESDLESDDSTNVPEHSEEGTEVDDLNEPTIEEEDTDLPIVDEEPSDTPEESLEIQMFNATTTTMPFKEGDRDEQIREIKKKLNHIGFGTIKETTLYGSFMTKRIKEFQKYYGLTVTGKVDKTTLAKIDEVYNSPFQRGKSHSGLIPLKKKLNWTGYGRIAVSSNFGSFTESRVKKFQKDHGLRVSGIIDKKTENKINDVFTKTFQVGSRHDSVVELKRLLNANGFGTIKLTTLYGSFTEKRVKEFQAHYGLKSTGKADLATLDKLQEVNKKSLRKGTRNNNVIQLKKNLNRLGFGNIKETNYYGSFTEKRVKDFQRYYGLKVTGIADQKTLNKINEVLASPLQRGKSHSDLIAIKKKLNWTGYGNIKVTRNFGSLTEKRVKQFQKDHGLPVSGIIEPKTKQKIDDVFSKTFQVGSRHDSVVELKRLLNANGFGTIKLTTLYGSFTEKRVKEFQAYYGLKATGQANLATLDKLVAVNKVSLRQGDRHTDVIQLKKMLNRIGFGKIRETKLYGSFTEKRVKDFQRYYGLKVTGIADSKTLAEIDKVYKSPFQNGKRHQDTIKLKQKLNRLGFGTIKETTLYGSFTEKRVKEFQAHYGLVVNGIADKRTLAKIDEILASPFQLGKRHPETKEIKQQLNLLGYNGIAISDLFGSHTEKRLKEFQKDYGLPVSGIADDITRKKLTLAAKEAEQRPKEKTTYTNYPITLEKALDIQIARPIIITDKYRNDPAYVSAKYIKFSGLSKISGTRVNIRTAPDLTSKVAYTFTGGTPIEVTGSVTGTSISGSKLWYRIVYKGQTLYVHSSFVADVPAEATANVNVRQAKSSSSHIFGKLSKGQKVTIVVRGNTWHEIKYGTWRNPTRADMKYYLDPNNNDKFQHLLLTESVGVSSNELNKVLEGKGILSGKGQAFINGAKTHKVNEIYLISHAFLESGHGTSKLANGVEVGKNSKGNLVLVTSSNRSSLKDIKKTYNMFGIGAYDSDPLRLGAIRAYNEGWFTPEAAIEGGAKFIGENYIHNQYGQNTLYKMKWNPKMHEGAAWKQYATDIAWAVKQTSQMKRMYEQLDNPTLHYDIVRYQ